MKNTIYTVTTQLTPETYQPAIELLQNVQKSVTQINEGKGIEHSEAENW